MFLSCKGVLPVMREQRSGSIISISSIVGQMGNFGQANYAVTKAGAIAFTNTGAIAFLTPNATQTITLGGTNTGEPANRYKNAAIALRETASAGRNVPSAYPVAMFASTNQAISPANGLSDGTSDGTNPPTTTVLIVVVVEEEEVAANAALGATSPTPRTTNPATPATATRTPRQPDTP
jgi:NAD(P)-dependent dehydrogenase (short-subunit alcohol dehydrogenase family)